MGAQKNFMAFAQWVGEQWKQSDADFNDEFFRNAVAKAILFRHAERMVTRQPWYQHGYRANIVAYTIALLTSLIKSRAPGLALDLRGIWARQSVSTSLDNQLALIAKAAFDVIVSPSHGFQNVTEWCKKEICWQRIRESHVRLASAFTRELVGEDEMRAVKKDARVQQHISSGIEAQSTVVNLGAAYWSRLGEWGRRNRLLSDADEKLLKIAARIPDKIPTDWQSATLLEIVRRMEEEGFRAD
jgi:hypothetical protein